MQIERKENITVVRKKSEPLCKKKTPVQQKKRLGIKNFP